MGQNNTSHTSVCELKLCTSSYPKNFTTRTLNFTPVFNKTIECYFEANHKTLPNTSDPSNPKSSFDLALKFLNKPHSSDINPAFVLDEMRVEVYYPDGSLFKEYEPKTNIKVEEVDSITFESVKLATHARAGFCFITSDHYNKMKDNFLNLKCTIGFKQGIIEKSIIAKTPSDFINNFKSAYESGAFHDFVFNVGSKLFPAHKFVLVAHSPVFTKMLTQDFQESKANNATITDTKPETFEMFLKYLYTGMIGDKSWPSVRDLYSLADKYDVEVLKNSCNSIIVSLMSIDLVCDILKLAYTYDDTNLKAAAKQFAVKHLKELTSREDWKNLVAISPLIGYEVVVNLAPA